MKPIKPIYYVLVGMLAGGMAGLLLFYHLDQSKGWNPYGWWFPVTFIATVVGGLSGVFICGVFQIRQGKL